jgi:hypothetical protein
VWCVKEGVKGKSLSIGVLTAKLDCVWIPASKFFTSWIPSKFQPLEVVSMYIKINYSFTVIKLMS